MDFWLVSFIFNHHWKWIYNLSRLQQTKSPHQNKRVYCFTCRGGFLCWFGRYSFNVLVRHYKHLPLTSRFDVLGDFVRLLFSNTSVVNLCSLVLDRFIAIVHPLKYITLMTRRRITQVIFFSWGLTVSFNALKVIYYVFYFKTMDVLFIWLNLICFEFLPTVVLILCFVSMIVHVRRHDRSARIVEKQLRFNHQVSFKTHYEKSAVIMMGLVIGVFLVCYGMYLRCSFLILSSSRCNDENYKILFLVLNSAINPLAYAFFKRDIKKEFQRLVGAVF